MSITLTKADRARLDGVHPKLVRVVLTAAALSRIPFTVLEGKRTLARQRQLVAEGHSHTMKSRHLTGRAVDIAPLEGDRPSFSWPQYFQLAPIIKLAAEREGVAVVWGGDWRKFRDGPHWQLDDKEP